MTVYFLHRKGWSLETIEGIMSNMKNKTMVYHSKESPPKADIVIRWGCTSTTNGEKHINKASAIHKVYDKSGFRAILQEQGLCPMTYTSNTMGEIDPLGYPYVVRPSVHCQAENFHICNTLGELLSAVSKCGEGFYISKFIKKTHEYRVFVAQGRVVTVLEKFPKVTGQEVWNDVEEYVGFDDWPLSVIKAAVAAHNLSDLDWSAVDIITDHTNRAYVLELNTAPEIQSPYRQKCMAKVFDWMIEKGSKPIPPADIINNWTKAIHPAISSAAFVGA